MCSCGTLGWQSQTVLSKASQRYLLRRSFTWNLCTKSSVEHAGHSIKKGWHVNVDATCIHYDPSIYKDPVQFNPSRFDVNMPSSPPFVSLSCNFLDQHVTDEHFKALTIALPATNLQEMQKPYSFIPFGSGPRTCLGMNMAKVTMLAFLHRLTSGYRYVYLQLC